MNPDALHKLPLVILSSSPDAPSAMPDPSNQNIVYPQQQMHYPDEAATDCHKDPLSKPYSPGWSPPQIYINLLPSPPEQKYPIFRTAEPAASDAPFCPSC